MEGLQIKKKQNTFEKHQKNDLFFRPLAIQPKLKVNSPGDKYEQEADSMADQVIQRLSQSPSNQDTLDNSENTNRRTQFFSSENNSKFLKPVSTSIPFNAPIQAKCEACEAEENETSDEEGIQRKPQHHIFLQADGDEEDSNLMAKRGNSKTPTVSAETTAQLFASKGSGNPLPKNTLSEMERGFGADFSNVRTHTDSSAVDMSKNLGAQAFTHGSDIYFNSGKFDAQSQEGKRLLAHELTHVVQQGNGFDGNKMIQREIFGNQVTFNSQEVCPPQAEILQSGAKDSMIAEELYGNSEMPIDYIDEHNINVDYENLLDVWKPIFVDCVSPEISAKDKPEIPVEQMQCRADVEFIGDTEMTEATVSASKGIRLHTTPDPLDCDYINKIGISSIIYPKDSKVTVIASGNISNAGWVKLLTLDGNEGWIEERFIARTQKNDLKDAVTKEKYVIQAGDNLEGVIKEEYKDYPYETGNDRRTIAHALYILNKDESKAFYFEGKGESWWKDFLDSDFTETRNIYATIKLKEGKLIRLPSKAYIDLLRDKGQVGVRADWKNTAIEFARSIEGFVEGAIYGFGKAIVDTFVGLWDLVKGIFTGELFEQAYDFYKQIEANGVKYLWELVKGFFIGVYKDFENAWNNPNPYKKWFFFGEIIGMIIFEIVIAFLTAGAGLARHLGKLGKIFDAVPGLRKLATKASTKIDDIPAGEAKKLSQVKSAEGKIENLGDMTGETRKMLRDPKNEQLLDSLNANPKAAKALKKCASNCFPEFARPDQVKEIDDLLVKIDTHFDNADYEGLKTYFHEAKTVDELEAKIETLRSVSNKVIDEKSRGRSPLLDTLEKTEKVRNSPGIARGGDSLRTINKVEDWIIDGDFRFLSFPKQIATKMKGQRFGNFRQFRETFWKLVSEDEVLRQAFPSSSNQIALKKGHAPFGKDGSKYELNHKHALEIIDQTYDEINTDLVFDFDNIEILTKKTHDLMKQ